MSAIAKSYWRSVQRGARTFAAVPDSQKEAVRALARADVEAGLLDRETFLELIGGESGEEADGTGSD